MFKPLLPGDSVTYPVGIGIRIERRKSDEYRKLLAIYGKRDLAGDRDGNIDIDLLGGGDLSSKAWLLDPANRFHNRLPDHSVVQRDVLLRYRKPNFDNGTTLPWIWDHRISLLVFNDFGSGISKER